jgi:hypothetical protein
MNKSDLFHHAVGFYAFWPVSQIQSTNCASYSAARERSLRKNHRKHESVRACLQAPYTRVGVITEIRCNSVGELYAP